MAILQWDIFTEKAGVWGAADFTKNGLVDHINTTKDTTDYLWHTTSVYVNENESFLSNGSRPKLVISSNGHALLAFINQKLEASTAGNGGGSAFKFDSPINLKAGKNDIDLLGMTVGLSNAGPFYDFVPAGLTSVKLEGFNSGTIDLSSNTWIYKIGIEGEHLKIYQPPFLSVTRIPARFLAYRSNIYYKRYKSNVFPRGSKEKKRYNFGVT
ncbi:beta-galactosidase 10-like [Papaver somniferum]|uniref:beta-galactosidase 10-like n=1 Tax=Papaver somniferum TaxID=3469 RepID=UPI000E6FA7A3|nr:beta-galactosidase 10-like [Papaver somniferum]